MGPLTDGLNGRLGCPDQFRYLTIRKLRVKFNQPEDRSRAVLTLGQRRIARTTTFFFTHGSGIKLQRQLMRWIGLRFVQLFLGQLIVGNWIEAFYASRHISIGNALNFKLMHFNKVSNLLKAESCIVHQPNCGGFCHNRFCHLGLHPKLLMPDIALLTPRGGPGFWRDELPCLENLTDV